MLQDKKSKLLQLRKWKWEIRLRIHHHPSSHCNKNRLHKKNMYNSSCNIIHRDSFCNNSHTSHKLQHLVIFQVDTVTTSQCHNKCHVNQAKWHPPWALYLYVLKLNFSNVIPEDTEIWQCLRCWLCETNLIHRNDYFVPGECSVPSTSLWIVYSWLLLRFSLLFIIYSLLYF